MRMGLALPHVAFSRICCACLRASVDARLVVFDALPHASWYNSDLPGSIEANHLTADFFLAHLAK